MNMSTENATMSKATYHTWESDIIGRVHGKNFLFILYYIQGFILYSVPMAWGYLNHKILWPWVVERWNTVNLLTMVYNNYSTIIHLLYALFFSVSNSLSHSLPLLLPLNLSTLSWHLPPQNASSFPSAQSAVPSQNLLFSRQSVELKQEEYPRGQPNGGPDKVQFI